MDDRDPFADDGDGDAAEAVARAFEQIAEAIRGQHEDTAVRLQELDRALARHTGVLGDLIRTEYAGELGRLGKSVNDLVRKQDALAEALGKQRIAEAARDLHGASWALEERDAKLAGATRDLEALGRKMDGIVARPAARAQQSRSLQLLSAAGALCGMIAILLGLWALPDGGETRMAATIMGDSYWGAAWRMMEANDPERRRTLGVLTWIDAGPEEAERHRACRDRAWESGERQECTVVFKPRSGR